MANGACNCEHGGESSQRLTLFLFTVKCLSRATVSLLSLTSLRRTMVVASSFSSLSWGSSHLHSYHSLRYEPRMPPSASSPDSIGKSRSKLAFVELILASSRIVGGGGGMKDAQTSVGWTCLVC